MIDLIVTYLIGAAIHTYTCLIKGATTFRKMTFSIMAFRILNLMVTLCNLLHKGCDKHTCFK